MGVQMGSRSDDSDRGANDAERFPCRRLFLTEFGTEDVALAGAGWAARAQDASTLFKNPAGMSRLEGNHFQGGLQALYFAGSFVRPWPRSAAGGGGNPVGVVPE